ncbi:MAG: L-histidine N(alpha)-methyltransferase [Lautropia sp.]
MPQAAIQLQEWRRRSTDRGAPRFCQIDAGSRQVSPRDELIDGLSQQHPRIAPKFFYDELGSHLFEAITLLDEYYPTRTEVAVFEQHRREIAASVGAGCTLIDLGAGNCAKAASLFASLRPAGYVAVDISVEFVRRAVQRLADAHPEIAMAGVGMDFSDSLPLPDFAGMVDGEAGVPLFFYPGSSIGNFTPPQALALLERIRARSGGGGLLIGVDLLKPVDQLVDAYDDALGVTAAFNRNVLRHANRLIGADFDPTQWRHVALFNQVRSRIEMHLEATRAVEVRWHGGGRSFTAGERIHTESAYKYTAERFAALLRQAGFTALRHWSDAGARYAVFHARAA